MIVEPWALYFAQDLPLKSAYYTTLNFICNLHQVLLAKILQFSTWDCYTSEFATIGALDYYDLVD